MAEDNTIAVSVRVSLELHARLSLLAGKTRRSVAETVRIALEEYLERELDKAA